MKVHTIYTDGGAYNNGRKNQSARICVVYENEVIVHENIGDHTSNEAEFIAMERAFEWITEHIPAEDVITLFSDSKMAVNMVTYLWQGQIQRIKDLRDRVASKLPNNVLIKWIYRDYNKAGQYLEFNLPRR